MQDSILYRITTQGPKTRARLLAHIQIDEILTRKQLAERSGLSYEQVRRQVGNLCLEGKLRSTLRDGKRWYWLRADSAAQSVPSAKLHRDAL